VTPTLPPPQGDGTPHPPLGAHPHASAAAAATMSTPRVHRRDDRVIVHHGDALDVLADMPDESVHAVVCDPAYGLSDISPDGIAQTITAWAAGQRDLVPDGKGFMGHDWDAFVPPPAVWDECLRVLKPGAHLLAFGGTRMFDLLTLSIRFAGFEIRDNIADLGFGEAPTAGLAWLYGTGWPKSRALLKPSFEPIVIARKPLTGAAAENVAAHGTGALNIDACRTAPGTAVRGGGGGNASGRSAGILGAAVPGNLSEPHTAGRWPTNVVLTTDAAGALDAQSGTSTSTQGSRRGASRQGTALAGGVLHEQTRGSGFGDVGGVSRYFPVFRYEPKAAGSERPSYMGADGKRVTHNTVKPLALMRWLVRLVTPAGGTVLDWCAGSGTTLEAAVLEGLHAVGIERHGPYLPLIDIRLDRVVRDLFTA
jgi:DNA methylase